jgi:hypothetical protein
MLEFHKMRREYVIDLRVGFFVEKSKNPEGVWQEFKFCAPELPVTPKFFPDSISADWESYEQDSKLAPMSEMAGTIYWVGEGEDIFVQTDQELVTKWVEDVELTEWFLYRRVAVAVDCEFDWDFDDEDGTHERFDDEINLPFFLAIRLQTDRQKIAWFSTIGIETHQV